MTLQDNVLIKAHAIDSEDLDFFAEYLRSAWMADSLVSKFDEDADSAAEWVVNKNIRDTQEVRLTADATQRVNRIVDSGVEQFINAFYGVEVRDWEVSQILHYGVGGHYIPHVDAETLLTDELNLRVWEKTLDRDLSIVYFLNDDFEGGELKFPDLDLSIKPKAGTLICFPSDHNYVHGVTPVTSGHRYTLVTWLRVKGMPTMDEINAMTMDEFNRMRPKQMEQGVRICKK